jgi:hypothetical protein
MVMHFCNPSIWEAKAGKLEVASQSGLHSKTLSQKQIFFFFFFFFFCLNERFREELEERLRETGERKGEK